MIRLAEEFVKDGYTKVIVQKEFNKDVYFLSNGTDVVRINKDIADFIKVEKDTE